MTSPPGPPGAACCPVVPLLSQEPMSSSSKRTSRLSQWDGPRRSTRCHESLLAGLRNRPALGRIGIVLAATLALTALAFFWGPPFPYRSGEVWAHEVRARVTFT